MAKIINITDRTFKGKPILVVFFKEGNAESYPFSIPRYRQSYFDFFKIAQSHFSVFVVRGKSLYRGRGVFARGYYIINGACLPWRHAIAATVVFDKGSLNAMSSKGWSIICEGRLSHMLARKDLIYRRFHRFMKKTFRVRSRADCARALMRIRGEKAVFKPVDKFGGVGVIIAEKNALIRTLRRHDGVVTEFVDTSEGIPGIVSSLHDLRATVMDGTIVQVMVRIPRPGSYLANIARGGSAIQLYPRQLPRSVYRIVRSIDNELKGYGHRVYSVDVGFERGMPYIFELNNEPGLPSRTYGTVHYKRWHRGLLKVLRAAARDAGQKNI